MIESHKEPNYMGVFLLLTVLTAVEIGVIYLPIPKLIIGTLLIVLALSKAVLVALYFMHLKFEKRTLGIIALTPLVLCTLLIISLLPDLTGTAHQTKSEKAAKDETAQEVANVNDNNDSESVNK